MTYSRKYNFKNNTFADAEQIDAEFDQLIAAVNNIEAADNSKDAELRKIAQLSKITNDSGGVKLSVSVTTGDILQTIVAAGQGMYTFYAVSGSKNLPANGTSGSIRGIAQMTSANYGWIWATDYLNNIYTNYIDTGVWRGWRRLVSDKDTQGVLWTGAAYMVATTTATPTKKLSECRNGWILVWSDYDAGTGSNDYDVFYSFIPKSSPFVNGYQNMFIVPNYQSDTSKGGISWHSIIITNHSIIKQPRGKQQHK
jgi:hypothetical protein